MKNLIILKKYPSEAVSRGEKTFFPANCFVSVGLPAELACSAILKFPLQHQAVAASAGAKVRAVTGGVPPVIAAEFTVEHGSAGRYCQMLWMSRFESSGDLLEGTGKI